MLMFPHLPCPPVIHGGCVLKTTRNMFVPWNSSCKTLLGLGFRFTSVLGCLQPRCDHRCGLTTVWWGLRAAMPWYWRGCRTHVGHIVLHASKTMCYQSLIPNGENMKPWTHTNGGVGSAALSDMVKNDTMPLETVLCCWALLQFHGDCCILTAPEYPALEGCCSANSWTHLMALHC